MLAVRTSAAPRRRCFVSEGLHLRPTALHHRPARRSSAAGATTRSRRRGPCASVAKSGPHGPARRESVHVVVRPLHPTPRRTTRGALKMRLKTRSKSTLLRVGTVRHMQEPSLHTPLGTRSLAVLRRSSAESYSSAAPAQPEQSPSAFCGGTNTATNSVAAECA